MQCWTLHTTHTLQKGIICTRTNIDGDKPCWSVWTGSPHPMGILEVTHYPVTDRMQVGYLQSIGWEIQLDMLCQEAHTLLIKNQSPIGGAWSMELLGNAEIISSGYVPQIRGKAQGEGAEYLLNLPYGSMVKIALCNAPKGENPYRIIRSLESELTIDPSTRESFLMKGVEGDQQPLGL